MTAAPFSSAIAREAGRIEGDACGLVPWWSLTKSVLAAAVLRLTDQRVLGLDDRFEDWPFTIRQMLQHMAGLTTYGGPLYHQAVAHGDTVWSVDDLLQRYNARQLIFHPGEGWAYSNLGYLFARQLVERATGVELHRALDRLVFGPMRITGTRLARTPGDMDGTVWGNRSRYDPRWVYHGLLIGPPADAVAFLRTLLTGDFLSPAALAAMQTRHAIGGALPDRPWTDTGYGLGLMIGSMGEAGRALGHSGVGPDTVAALYMFPDLPGSPVAAAFGPGADEGSVEREVARLASHR